MSMVPADAPRRAAASVSPVPRFELALESPVQRATATVNVRWDDKAVFDAIQAWLSYRRGRPVSQWDAFTLILATALENAESELGRAQLFAS